MARFPPSALLTLIALVPLPFGSHRPLFWSLLALLVGLLLLLARDLPPPPPSRLLLWGQTAFLLVLLWIGLQTLPVSPHPIWEEARVVIPEADAALSVDPFVTWTAWMRLAGYGAVFWLTASLARSGRWAERALGWFVAAEAFYAIYGLIAYFFFPDHLLWFRRWAYTGNLTATFVNRNHYATYAGIGILATMALIVEQMPKPPPVASRRQRWQLLLEGVVQPQNLLLYGVLALLSAALILTQSRGGSSATLAAVALFLLLVRHTGGFPRWVFRIVGGVVLGTMLLLLSVGGEPLLNRFTRLSDVRPEVYRATWQAVQDHFWTGSGYGTFTEIFEMYRPKGLGKGWRYAHNTYLENMLELGVPAFLLLSSAVAAVAGRCLLGVVRRRRRQAFPLLGVTATALVGLHALVDFSLQIPAVAVSYAFLLGIAYSQSFRSSERRER